MFTPETREISPIAVPFMIARSLLQCACICSHYRCYHDRMFNRHNLEVLKTRLLSGGGLLGAVLASACCLLPLTFAFIGVSGAWIGHLTALAPYQPVFLAIGAACVGWGLWRSYGSPARCEHNCRTPLSRRVTRVSLWCATVLLALAATVDFWAPLFT